MKATVVCVVFLVLAMSTFLESAVVRKQRETSLAALERTVQQLSSTVENHEVRLSAAEYKMTVEGRAVSFRVEFYQHGQSHTITLSKTEPIKFDHVATNYGNAYSGTTGKFTAPYEGIYGFYLHIMGGESGRVTLAIYSTSLDGEGIACAAFAEGSDLDSNDQASCATALHLRAGDQVYVKYFDYDPIVWSAYSYFVGALIQPL
ncbi:hypothetical protein BaRGS_00031294 [Batillaria attramentaria]|uniref:C1q domain-containing protein n=1 Tax=Batillaria attramentaria TaxID=370345 RepID=A0ABD0JQY1_9CAEN